MATTAASDSAVAESSFVQEKMDGPLKIPIGAPLDDCKPVLQAALTSDQQTKYDWLLEQVKAWKEVPSHKGKVGPLTESERMWLTRECLFRYLRATKWHEKEAEKRLRDTLTWRRDFGVEGLTFEHISPEQETGKQTILGYDKEGHPCHYLNPGRQNTQPSHRQVEHLVFMVERVLEIMPAQQEKLALLINFKQSKNRSYTAPGIGQGREVLHILQTHYPERLGKALILNVPWVVWGFFKLITPFIDPLTREKLKFNEDMRQYVPSEQLWTEFHGSLEFEYDHSIYWPALEKLCGERREERTRRWTAGGKQIGELEDYLSGYASHGVSPQQQPAGSDEPDVVVAANGKAAEALAGEQQQNVTTEEPKVEEPKATTSKAEEAKVEDLKVEELKV